MDFRSVLFNYSIDTLCLHWPFVAELARYGTRGLGNLRQVAVLVEHRRPDLSAYAPIHFIELSLRCAKLESFHLFLLYSPDGTGITSDGDEWIRAKVERMLMETGDMWEWTDCVIPWPEGSTPVERQAMYESCLKRWRNIVKVTLLKIPEGQSWRSSLDACLLGSSL
jgi:hypothetical protein